MEGSSFRRTWSVAVGGLAAVAVGAILEYGFEVLPRFVLELVGFPILIVGMFMLGVSLRSEGGAGLGKVALMGLSGLVAVIIGGASVGHLPSVPALIPVAACVVIGFTGLPFASLTTKAVQKRHNGTYARRGSPLPPNEACPDLFSGFCVGERSAHPRFVVAGEEAGHFGVERRIVGEREDQLSGLSCLDLDEDVAAFLVMTPILTMVLVARLEMLLDTVCVGEAELVGHGPFIVEHEPHGLTGGDCEVRGLEGEFAHHDLYFTIGFSFAGFSLVLVFPVVVVVVLRGSGRFCGRGSGLGQHAGLRRARRGFGVRGFGASTSGDHER